LDREECAPHVDIEDLIELLGRDGAQRCKITDAGFGEQDIKRALVGFNGREKSVEVSSLETSPWIPFTPGPIALTAASSWVFLRPKIYTNAPSATNFFADARPMPVVPPVITAILPSSLPIEVSIWRAVLATS
jgi:hypothetical protein